MDISRTLIEIVEGKGRMLLLDVLIELMKQGYGVSGSKDFFCEEPFKLVFPDLNRDLIGSLQTLLKGGELIMNVAPPHMYVRREKDLPPWLPVLESPRLTVTERHLLPVYLTTPQVEEIFLKYSFLCVLKRCLPLQFSTFTDLVNSHGIDVRGHACLLNAKKDTVYATGLSPEFLTDYVKLRAFDIVWGADTPLCVPSPIEPEAEDYPDPLFGPLLVTIPGDPLIGLSLADARTAFEDEQERKRRFEEKCRTIDIRNEKCCL